MAQPGRPKTIMIERDQVNIRLPREMIREIRALADAGERPFTNEMVRVLREGLKVVRAHRGTTDLVPGGLS